MATTSTTDVVTRTQEIRDRSAEEMFGADGTPRVVVVGAGFGGLGAGVKLKKAGIDSFTIYESSTGVGGTWWDNTYPGAEVDVNSNLYRYSFKPHRWTRSHAGQPELQAYLEETADEFGLRPHLQLGVAVLSAVWDDRLHLWTVALDTGDLDVCHVVISAVGFLNVPRFPTWPGLEDFGGPRFHTSRWDHRQDLSGEAVAVVGTGSTATQVVPAVQPIVEKHYVFQREPGWVLPKGERQFTEAERVALARPWWRAWDRFCSRWGRSANITVPEFPNLFLLYGPGTNGGELVSMLEAQAEYAVRSIKRMARRRVSAVEVRPVFESLWNVWLQSRMEGTSWTLSNNYFTSRTGRIVTQWPSGNVVYRVLTKLLGRISATARRSPGRTTAEPLDPLRCSQVTR